MNNTEPIPITRENSELLLLKSIKAERWAAMQWLARQPEWRRRKLEAGDARNCHPDRIAEAQGWVRFTPSVWLTPTRAERNYLSDAIRRLQTNGLVEVQKSGSRITHVKLTDRGMEALKAETANL